MRKIRRIWQKSIFKNYFLMIISFLLLEIIFRSIDNLPLVSWHFVRIFLGLNILALIFSFLFSFFKYIVQKILVCFIVLAFSVYGFLELGFHNFLGVYASISTNTQMGAVTSYIKDFLFSVKALYYLMFIPFLLILIYYLAIDKKVSVILPKRKVTKKYVMMRFFPIFIVILLSLGYFYTLKLDFMQDKLQVDTSYDVFNKPTNTSLAIKDFGYITFLFLDFREWLIPSANVYAIDYNPSDIKTTVTYEEQVTIDNAIFMDIIENETNETLNTLNKYFLTKQTTTTNEYTGLFEDKNVIMIMVESGGDILLNEEYYPNIARLSNSSYNWLNYYSPRNICSTGNNEMSILTGLYSINNNCTANVYKGNIYFESIFNLFNEKGYITNSFHNHYDQYYYRNIIHKNMGSQTYYGPDKLGIKTSTTYGNWASDEELMKKYLEVIDSQDLTQPFMSFITTVSSHQPYNSNNVYADLYVDMFPEEYPLSLRRYMSTLKVVDNAIGILLDGLEERDLLDDTVIVLFGDHYPYALSTDTLNYAFDYDVSVDQSMEQVPFLIYCKDLEAKTFDAYVSYVNIIPTIANLFNLNFDSRLYMGSDQLSDDYESLVIFADGSWKNEIAYYDAKNSKIKYYTQKMYSDEEILAINTEVQLKLEMSSLAIKKNYFNYLDEKINSYTISE